MTILQQYLSNVSKSLTCSNSNKKALFLELNSLLQDYLSANPESDYLSLEQAFGKPEAIASTYLNTLPSDVIDKAVRRKKHLKKACFIALSAFIIMTSILFTYSSHVRHTVHITKESTITIIEKG